MNQFGMLGGPPANLSRTIVRKMLLKSSGWQSVGLLAIFLWAASFSILQSLSWLQTKSKPTQIIIKTLPLMLCA